MRKHLHSLLSSIPLILLLTLTALCILSFFKPTTVDISRDWYEEKLWTSHTLSLTSSNGGILFQHTFALATESDVSWGVFPNHIAKWDFDIYPPYSKTYPELSDEVTPGHSFLGFAIGSTDSFMHASWRQGFQNELIIPYPTLLLLLAIPTTRILHRHFRNRRRKQLGLCPTCNYDLRAHAPNSNCPECGTPVSIPRGTRPKDHP